MLAGGVEKVAGTEVVRAGEDVTDGWKLGGVVDGGELETAGNEAGAVEANGMRAHGGVVGGAFRRGGDVTGGKTPGEALIEGRGIIEASPLVGNAFVDFAGEPPAIAAVIRFIAGVGGIDTNACRVVAVKDIAGKGTPGVAGVGVSDSEGFGGGDLRRGRGVAGDEGGGSGSIRAGDDAAGAEQEAGGEGEQA